MPIVMAQPMHRVANTKRSDDDQPDGFDALAGHGQGESGEGPARGADRRVQDPGRATRRSRGPARARGSERREAGRGGATAENRAALWPTIRIMLLSHERGEVHEVYPVLRSYPELAALADHHD